MDQQFMVRLNRETNPEYQRLPTVFGERFYDGEDYVFLVSNNRYRYICLVRLMDGDTHVYGDEWRKFVEDNITPSIKTLHFVKEALGTFYVTGYSVDGTEGSGYDRRTVGNRVVRCLALFRAGGGQVLPGYFLQNIWKERLTVHANGISVSVKHERVQLDMNSVVRSNRLFGKRWEKLVEDLGMEIGQPMVFTNLGDYQLNLGLFRHNGTCVYRETVPPTLLRLPGREIPDYAMEEERAHHICTWEGHTEHNDENHVFYVMLDGTVLEFYHVSVPKGFAGDHELIAYRKAILIHVDQRFPVKVATINDYQRTNRQRAVKLNGNFKAFAGMCRLRHGRLIRFKLVNIVVENEDGENNEIPVFHVC